jgi:Flp pilus assembly protein TadD
LEKATEYWGKEYAKKPAKKPNDGTAALSYARNLKALGRKPEALAVLQSAYIANAQNREFLSEYGRLALDAGQVSAAAELLAAADDPAKPDWKTISARGTVLAKQGKYKESIAYFERARLLAPQQSSVLNNLAMAYTMTGEAERAEGLLREAAQMKGSDPRVRQNLALVMGLQGKTADKTPVQPAVAHDSAAITKPAATPPMTETAPTSTPPPPALAPLPARALSSPVANAETLATQTASLETASLPWVTKPPVKTKTKMSARAAKSGGPVPAARKPLDPDEIITAAVQAEMTREP